MDSEVHYYGQIARENDLGHSTWSIDSTQFTEPHRFEGVTQVRHQTYSDPEPVFASIEGPTWLDIWRPCDAVIGQSRNGDHRYIEGFKREYPGGPESKPDTTVLSLVTGS